MSAETPEWAAVLEEAIESRTKKIKAQVKRLESELKASKVVIARQKERLDALSDVREACSAVADWEDWR